MKCDAETDSDTCDLAPGHTGDHRAWVGFDYHGQPVYASWTNEEGP